MDNPNITMKEYIRLEEEKACRHGKVYNLETAKYGKIWNDEDVHGLRSVETEFPAIAFNDELTSEKTLSCEPTISSLNINEIDFRISFDESDDEDYTVIFDKNSFSYKIISVNDLKMDLENDNEKVNMPSFPSPEPKVSCFDDLDFFKDFKNEFPAIVYNDALTSKSDYLTEPTLSPQHIDEFDLKDETSLSEYDEVEQNNRRFKIYNLCTNLIDFADMALPPRDQRHWYLRADDRDWAVLERSVLDLVYSWTLQFSLGEVRLRILERVPDKGDLSAYWIGISSARDFLGITPSYNSIRDPMLWLCHKLIACSIAGRSQAPKKHGAMISGGQFVACLAEYFGLLTKERLQGLTMIVRDLPVIDMTEIGGRGEL
ncbi:hypothetical protein Tco_0353662 [Tanacetum coccineum]